MATFDPQIQSIQPPDWTGVTKPISQPEADKSKGIALDTAATGLSEGVQLAENTEQDYLKDKVRSGVDALRDTTTAAYESIRRAQIAGVPPDPRAVQTAGFTGSLVAADPDVPDGLSAGLDKASNLALAKGQGKANDTLYTGALVALTKQLRSEYPGHRDFIDQQIAQVSGKNPANAYMDNLLTDVNKNSAGGSNPMQNHILSLAFNERNTGNPEVQSWIQAVRHNIPNAMDGLTSAVMKSENNYWQANQWQAQRTQTKGNLEDQATIAQSHFDQRANQLYDEAVSPVVDIPGLTQPKKMMDLISDDAAGRLNLTPTQRDGLVTALGNSENVLKAKLAQTYTQEGFSTAIRDPAYLKSKIDEKVQALEAMKDSVTNEKYGTAFAIQRQNKAEVDTATQQAYHSPIGQWMKDRAVMNTNLGPNWVNYADSLGIQKTYLKDIQEFYSRATNAAMVSPDLRTATGVQSLYDSLTAAKKASQAGSNVPSRAYDDLVGNVGIITKAAAGNVQDQAVAKNVVDYMFDPQKNSRVMDFFGRDFVDDQGKIHKGKFSAFDTLTAPKVADSVYSLKDSAAWGKYKDWTETSFKSLFGNEINQLNNIQGDKSIPFSLSWDSEAHRFGLNFKQSQDTVDSVSQNYIKEATRSVNALNSGLQNLSYMHSKEGGDTNAYLFDMLLGLGYSPNDKLHGDNLPQKAVEAIAASQRKPGTPADAYRMTR